jgi:hypothetical protein
MLAATCVRDDTAVLLINYCERIAATSPHVATCSAIARDYMKNTFRIRHASAHARARWFVSADRCVRYSICSSRAFQYCANCEKKIDKGARLTGRRKCSDFSCRSTLFDCNPSINLIWGLRLLSRFSIGLINTLPRSRAGTFV